MNAMILAAGRGERLGEWTEHIPKPLVKVSGLPVIEHTLIRLSRLKVKNVIINTWYLADKLIAFVGDGSKWGLQVLWSHETCCLNTGGGVVRALRYLGNEPFLAINGDILWDMELTSMITSYRASMHGLLGLVSNPDYAKGDFLHQEDGRLLRGVGHRESLTYSGIQLLNPKAFSGYEETPFSLNRFYDHALKEGKLYGVRLPGRWADMGTPDRLEKVKNERWDCV